MSLPAHLAPYRTAHLWSDKTLADCAREWANRLPDAVIFPNAPSQPTYASLLADAEALASSLNELGITPGDVVSFQTPNWIEAAVINLAAAIGGFVINPIVPIYRDVEVLQMLSDSSAVAFFTCERFRNFDHLAMVERIHSKLPALRHVIAVRGSSSRATSYETLVAAGRNRGFSESGVDPDAPKLLLYTSGTTGHPKGVLHSHNTLARIARTSFKTWGINAGDAVLMPSPVTHISGYSNGLEQPFVTGTRTVLMEHWNASEALELIRTYRIVATVAATPFLQELAEQAQLTGSPPEFRIFACGGAAVPPDLVRNANRAFATPCAFRVYGSSETPLVTHGFPASNQPELAASTDGAIADYEVRILNECGDDARPGEDGEIVVRGPAMFMGYLDPAQTQEALTPENFFRTGDLGHISAEGALVVTGRKKDLIIRGGENISAKEVEDALHRHEAVLEAAVVAMPHPRLGEGICAFVILREGISSNAAEIMDFMANSGLARQKTPERIEFLTDFPRTASGKIRKDQLRLFARGGTQAT